MSMSSYARQLRTILDKAGVELTLVEPSLAAAFAESLAPARVVAFDALPTGRPAEATPPAGVETAVVNALPAARPSPGLPHLDRALERQLDLVAEALGSNRASRA